MLLKAADLVFGADDEVDDWERTLNMNDVWGWATSWCETIPEESLPEVGRLVRCYGYCGVLYWVSEQHDRMRSEFEDINRFVEFVRAEEGIRQEVIGSNTRAYAKRIYTIGETP